VAEPEESASTQRPGDRLTVVGLSAGYAGATVVRDVSLRVGEGEAVALLGRNGAGKTTTLLAIAGAVEQRSGSVEVGGLRVTGRPSFQVARAGLSLVPQGRRIFPTLSVQENLLLGDRSGDLEPVHSLFPVLAERSRQPGSALSGGEQQMLAIGRALMTRPSVLLMDEPSEGLAPQLVRSMGDLIGRLRREQGLAILLAEQNLALALEVSDRVYVLERGEIVHEAPAAEFKEDKARQRRYLGV
jgi:branched-chain amino acid transport system ATP-binding protein